MIGDDERTPVEVPNGFTLLSEVRALRSEVRSAVNIVLAEHQRGLALSTRVRVLESKAMIVPGIVAAIALVLAALSYDKSQRTERALGERLTSIERKLDLTRAATIAAER